MTSVTVRVDPELNSWINENFPHGFKQMFLEECLKSLRSLVEGGTVLTPREQALICFATTIHTIQKGDQD